MPELIPGLVVDLQRVDTRGYSPNRLMQEFGEDPTGIKFNEITPQEGVDIEASSDYEYYIDSIKRTNAFALDMVSKNIDVNNPDPNNADALLAAKMYQNMKTDAAGLAVGLKSSMDWRKKHFEKDMQEGILGRPVGKGLVTSEAASGGLINMNEINKRVKAMSETLKGYSNIYATPGEVEKANLEFNKVKTKMENTLRADLANEGLEPDEIETALAPLLEQKGSRLNDYQNTQLGIQRENARWNRAAKQANIDYRKAKTDEVREGTTAALDFAFGDHLAVANGDFSSLRWETDADGREVSHDYNSYEINNENIIGLVKNPDGSAYFETVRGGLSTRVLDEGDPTKVPVNSKTIGRLFSASEKKAWNQYVQKQKFKTEDEVDDSLLPDI